MDVAEVGARSAPARPFEPVVRLRVLDRISGACAYRVALLAAPAGFGKSVAIRHFLEHAAITHVRFALRKEHATLLGFVRGFAECIEPFAPMAAKSVAGAYERAMQTPAPARELAIWLAALLREAEGTIVIDDLHIASEDAAAELVAELVDRTLPNLRWILSTRDLSPLPVATWFAQNACGMPVDENDLQLTPDEAANAAESAGVQLDADAIRELLSLTKSWPAAFAFALGVSSRTSDLKNIAIVTKHTVYRYLAEQVFGNLQQADRDFLMRTCLLPTLEPEVMIAGGLPEARYFLERLSQRTSFTTRESSDEYRYHDLFKDFLENEIRREGARAYETRLRETGRILETGGRVAQALNIYLTGNLRELVQRLLLRHGQQLIDRGFIELVDRALALIWADAVAGQPCLVALRAEIRSRMVQVDESVVLFGEALSKCSGDLYADIAQRFICVLLNNFRVNDAQAVALTIHLDAIANSGIQAIAKAVVATVHSISGREEEAERLVKQAVALVAVIDDRELEARILRLAAFVELRNGHPERARFYAQQAMKMAEQLGLYDQAARACTTLMSASVDLPFRNIRAAAALLMDYAERAGERLLVVIALINLFSLAATRGDDEELRHLSEDLATLDPKGDPRLTETYIPANALWKAGQGDFEAAYDLLNRSFSTDLPPTWCAARAAEMSLYAGAAGNETDADRWIEVLRRILDQDYPRQRPLDAALPQLILALTHAVLGRPGFAQSALREARKTPLWSMPGFGALAAAIDTYCSVVDLPDDSDLLVQRLERLTEDGLGGYARIIRQLPRCSPRAPTSSGGLTKMETRVLRALSEGGSSKTIAMELGRSPQTVDTHVKSILRKLECNSRQQAVSVARKLGIV